LGDSALLLILLNQLMCLILRNEKLPENDGTLLNQLPTWHHPQGKAPLKLAETTPLKCPVLFLLDALLVPILVAIELPMQERDNNGQYVLAYCTENRISHFDWYF
jgi:hypothetical protein